jgi:hypothetical protein
VTAARDREIDGDATPNDVTGFLNCRNIMGAVVVVVASSFATVTAAIYANNFLPLLIFKFQ